jgi:hypothetical protein
MQTKPSSIAAFHSVCRRADLPAENIFSRRKLFRTSLMTPLASCAYRQYSSGPKDHIMTVFDRKTKKMQRNKTAELENYEVYDYIKEEMGYRMYDRICDIKRYKAPHYP